MGVYHQPRRCGFVTTPAAMLERVGAAKPGGGSLWLRWLRSRVVVLTALAAVLSGASACSVRRISPRAYHAAEPAIAVSDSVAVAELPRVRCWHQRPGYSHQPGTLGRSPTDISGNGHTWMRDPPRRRRGGTERLYRSAGASRRLGGGTSVEWPSRGA